MTIAKPSKNSNSPQSQKKLFLFLNNLLPLFPCMVLSSLLGTYLDLYFTGKGFYSFPIRPMAEVFTIHIGFTLLHLPVLTAVFLLICRTLPFKYKGFFIVLIGVFITIIEKLAEEVGWFVHHHSWKHLYSLIGYSLYLVIIYCIYTFFTYHINKKQ
nr:CBO0543 family protein [uncultured Bacillus sp.]